jgi:hypothetical protein
MTHTSFPTVHARRRRRACLRAFASGGTARRNGPRFSERLIGYSIAYFFPFMLFFRKIRSASRQQENGGGGEGLAEELKNIYKKPRFYIDSVRILRHNIDTS